MALNAAALGPLLAAAAGSIDPPGQAAWLAIAQALVTYLQSNAVVIGVATGAMAGGPGVPVVAQIT